jgi:hypothetical protein
MTQQKRAHMGQKAKLTNDQIWHLVKGSCLLDWVEPNYNKMGPNGLPMPFKSWKHRKKLYFDFKSEIFDLQGQNIPNSHIIAFHFGARPAAWWNYESPERRRLLSGNADHILEWDPTFFGKPYLVSSLEAHNFLKFETQPEYLDRLDLLLPGEKQKIKPELIRV